MGLLHHERKGCARLVVRCSGSLRGRCGPGDTWTTGLLVAAGPAAYSDLVALPGGMLGVLHEAGADGPYEYIDFTSVGVDRLTGT